VLPFCLRRYGIMPTREAAKKLRDDLAAKLRRLDGLLDKTTRGAKAAGLSHNDAERERRRQQTRAAQDCSPIPTPEVEHPKRRTACATDLKRFCETYFPAAFSLTWSPDHLKVIARLERAIRSGGLFALAMPRGSGKSTLFRTSAIWSILYGYNRYVCLVAATQKRGEELLDAIKTALRFNDSLWEDFKRELHAIRQLDGEPRRCRGQTFEGESTQIEWGAEKLVFPTIPGSLASGAVLTGCGLTGGEIRGQSHTGPDGQIVLRPDLVLIDDPQTRASARSQTQSKERWKLLNGDVLLMSGPGQKLSGLAAVTVIEPEDMAERLLNRDASPDWHGEKMKMLYEFPTNTELWEQYAETRRASLRGGGDGAEATEFYREHREAMDAGAVVAWPERHRGDELSGLQHAMNLLIRDRAAFMAECQNDPEQEDVGLVRLRADDLVKQISGVERGSFAAEREKLTAYIDVHDRLLYWEVAAWSQGFAGDVVDYGTYPRLRSRYFNMRRARRTLKMVAPPGSDDDAAILAGLRALTDELLGHAWIRADGAAMQIDVLLIDIGYKPDLIRQLIQLSSHANRIWPAKGEGITAAMKPFSEYRIEAGAKIGDYWRIPPVRGTKQVRHVHIDTNFWKTFAHQRLAVPVGGAGCVTLFGKDEELHRLWAEHVAESEYFVPTEGRGRVVHQWMLRPHKPDNHWFDCHVGCHVGASLLGIDRESTVPRPKKKQVKLSELQRQKRAARSR
jgi:hypothetical protein